MVSAQIRPMTHLPTQTNIEALPYDMHSLPGQILFLKQILSQACSPAQDLNFKNCSRQQNIVLLVVHVVHFSNA